MTATAVGPWYGLSLVACLICAFPATPSWADEPAAGHVRMIKGTAFLGKAAAESPVAADTPVPVGSTLRTAADGSLGVVFADNTVVTLGPDTVFDLECYRYAPNKGEACFKGKITRGTLVYHAGAIQRLDADAVTIQSPGGKVALRGIHFAVKVDGE